MKILQVKRLPIYDIFLDDGWNHWTRVLLKKDHLIHLNGDRLNGTTTRDALQQLVKPSNTGRNAQPTKVQQQSPVAPVLSK